jgi:hypothetical protein
MPKRKSPSPDANKKIVAFPAPLVPVAPRAVPPPPKQTKAALAKLHAAFAGTHESFQQEIRAIAAEGGKSVDLVFGLWRNYTAECHDQSALLSEFREWYAGNLGLETRRQRNERERAEYFAGRPAHCTPPIIPIHLRDPRAKAEALIRSLKNPRRKKKS